MVKPGIHYPQQFVTVVLRNGATFQMSSIVKMTQPIFLEQVLALAQYYSWYMLCLMHQQMHLRCAALQDPTNNPLWTGKQVQDIKEESRAAKFLEKFSKMGIKGGSSS